MVRQRVLVPPFGGSNPSAPATNLTMIFSDSSTDMPKPKYLEDYLPILKKTVFHEEDLAKIERYFHTIILERADDFQLEDFIFYSKKHQDTLPKITNDLLKISKPAFFRIPGFYGGFAYILINEDGKPKLITDSWCRVVCGSGQRHEITTNGAKLVAEGFV